MSLHDDGRSAFAPTLPLPPETPSFPKVNFTLKHERQNPEWRGRASWKASWDGGHAHYVYEQELWEEHQKQNSAWVFSWCLSALEFLIPLRPWTWWFPTRLLCWIVWMSIVSWAVVRLLRWLVDLIAVVGKEVHVRTIPGELPGEDSHAGIEEAAEEREPSVQSSRSSRRSGDNKTSGAQLKWRHYALLVKKLHWLCEVLLKSLETRGTRRISRLDRGRIAERIGAVKSVQEELRHHEPTRRTLRAAVSVSEMLPLLDDALSRMMEKALPENRKELRDARTAVESIIDEHALVMDVLPRRSASSPSSEPSRASSRGNGRRRRAEGSQLTVELHDCCTALSDTCSSIDRDLRSARGTVGNGPLRRFQNEIIRLRDMSEDITELQAAEIRVRTMTLLECQNDLERVMRTLRGLPAFETLLPVQPEIQRCLGVVGRAHEQLKFITNASTQHVDGEAADVPKVKSVARWAKDVEISTASRAMRQAESKPDLSVRTVGMIEKAECTTAAESIGDSPMLQHWAAAISGMCQACNAVWLWHHVPHSNADPLIPLISTLGRAFDHANVIDKSTACNETSLKIMAPHAQEVRLSAQQLRDLLSRQVFRPEHYVRLKAVYEFLTTISNRFEGTSRKTVHCPLAAGGWPLSRVHAFTTSNEIEMVDATSECYDHPVFPTWPHNSAQTVSTATLQPQTSASPPKGLDRIAVLSARLQVIQTQMLEWSKRLDMGALRARLNAARPAPLVADDEMDTAQEEVPLAVALDHNVLLGQLDEINKIRHEVQQVQQQIRHISNVSQDEVIKLERIQEQTETALHLLQENMQILGESMNLREGLDLSYKQTQLVAEVFCFLEMRTGNSFQGRHKNLPEVKAAETKVLKNLHEVNYKACGGQIMTEVQNFRAALQQVEYLRAGAKRLLDLCHVKWDKDAYEVVLEDISLQSDECGRLYEYMLERHRGGWFLQGPGYGVADLERRVTQGFYPVEVEDEDFMSGLRALLTTVRSYHQQNHPLDDRQYAGPDDVDRILELLFVEEPLWYAENLAEPTGDYGNFLSRWFDTIVREHGLDSEAYSKCWNSARAYKNWNVHQLQIVLAFMVENGSLPQWCMNIRIGVVTREVEDQYPNTKATLEVFGDSPERAEPGSIVWLYNDNAGSICLDPPEISRWQGFSFTTVPPANSRAITNSWFKGTRLSRIPAYERDLATLQSPPAVRVFGDEAMLDYEEAWMSGANGEASTIENDPNLFVRLRTQAEALLKTARERETNVKKKNDYEHAMDPLAEVSQELLRMQDRVVAFLRGNHPDVQKEILQGIRRDISEWISANRAACGSRGEFLSTDRLAESGRRGASRRRQEGGVGIDPDGTANRGTSNRGGSDAGVDGTRGDVRGRGGTNARGRGIDDRRGREAVDTQGRRGGENRGSGRGGRGMAMKQEVEEGVEVMITGGESHGGGAKSERAEAANRGRGSARARGGRGRGGAEGGRRDGRKAADPTPYEGGHIHAAGQQERSRGRSRAPRGDGENLHTGGEETNRCYRNGPATHDRPQGEPQANNARGQGVPFATTIKPGMSTADMTAAREFQAMVKRSGHHYGTDNSKEGGAPPKEKQGRRKERDEVDLDVK